MQILTSADLPFAPPVAVTIGFFDGLHRGHRSLLAEVEKQPFPSLVYTFTRKPNVLRPLFTNAEKESILACAGIDYYYAQTFDERVQEESARTFLRHFMRSFKVKCLVVGSDFRFGSGAAGDVFLLQEMQHRYGYRLVVVPVQDSGEGKLSSTELRRLVSSGRLDQAHDLMGRYYFIDGIVEEGARLGTKLGVPTANITTNKLLPEKGVYATLTRTEEGLYPSVTNVGTRPTVSGGHRVTIETNILDHEEDLYSKPIRVYFVERLRPETKFASVDQLKRQILKDAARARRLLRDPDIGRKYEIC